jgi:hypothetical protein
MCGIRIRNDKVINKIFINKNYTTMKKSILILAGVLCLSGAAMAQDPAQTKDSTNQQTVPSTEQNYKKDMVKIKSTEVPASLKTTLQGTEYKGWENGTVYRNENSDMYLVEVSNGGTSTSYRFDANGKPIKP